MSAFVDKIGLAKFAMYIFDYGSPVGLRMAVAHPERVTAIVTQNGNAYVEGLSEAWKPIQEYWRERSQEKRDALRAIPEARDDVLSVCHRRSRRKHDLARRLLPG